jgi:ankyrin repeat protein
LEGARLLIDHDVDVNY